MTIFIGANRGDVDLWRAHLVLLYHYNLFIMCMYIVGEHCPFLITIILSWAEEETVVISYEREHAQVAKTMRMRQARDGRMKQNKSGPSTRCRLGYRVSRGALDLLLGGPDLRVVDLFDKSISIRPPAIRDFIYTCLGSKT